MTEDELLEYYKATKNSCDEIELMSKGGQTAYIFRHYTEYYTNKDYWLSLKTGTLFDYKSLSVFYEIPNSYNIFHSLKIGDIIVTVTAGDIKSYYKKIDDDVFIECDNAGHIKSCNYIQGFKHRIKFIFDYEEIIKMSDIVDRHKGGTK